MLATTRGQRLPETLESGGVPLVVTVRKVEPRNVHPRVHKRPEGLYAPARGAQGADDLGLPPRFITLAKDLALAAFFSPLQKNIAVVQYGPVDEKTRISYIPCVRKLISRFSQRLRTSKHFCAVPIEHNFLLQQNSNLTKKQGSNFLATYK